MQDYRVKTTVFSDESLAIKGLPFEVGDDVEVIVRCYKHLGGGGNRYPLQGTPVRYVDPFGTVAAEEWEALG